MSFDTKWAGASDIISDILKAKEAIEKQKIRQKQRYYECNIRHLKYDLDLARRQNDVSSDQRLSS